MPIKKKKPAAGPHRIRQVVRLTIDPKASAYIDKLAEARFGGNRSRAVDELAHFHEEMTQKDRR